MNLVTDRFVHDAVRLADDLPEAVGINRDGVETLHGNNRPRERKVGKPVGIVQDALAPSVGILDAESGFDLRKDIKKQAVRMRRPSDVHTATLLRFAARRFRNSSDSRFTCSCGIPLPSANSRREISMSRESSMPSSKASSDSASTRYEAARPFCVMRTGRCVSRTRLMYAERLLRHSENGTTSSDGRQRRIGISRTAGMAFSPLWFTRDIVQNSGTCVKGGGSQVAPPSRDVAPSPLQPGRGGLAASLTIHFLRVPLTVKVAIFVAISLPATSYAATRSFCMMRTGRCVSCTQLMYTERLLQYSENGTTSSDRRQRRMGISRTACMDLFSFGLDVAHCSRFWRGGQSGYYANC